MIDAGPVAVVVEASGQSLGITRAACAVPMRLTPATGARLTADARYRLRQDQDLRSSS
jgi:hypothetical protein